MEMRDEQEEGLKRRGREKEGGGRSLKMKQGDQAAVSDGEEEGEEAAEETGNANSNVEDDLSGLARLSEKDFNSRVYFRTLGSNLARSSRNW
eukprot:m.313842 g.313842  ORF g.313842 m.313842 type:complete len:92 (+) comp439604_c0_seq1:140-415(+)